MKQTLIVTIFIVLISISKCGEDYYRLLGVKRDASKAEIRRAFKKLSLQYHPDKNKNKKNPEKAKEMFIKIANAYEVLNDDKLRKIYDQHGEEGVKQHQQGGGQQHGGNFQDIFNFFFRGGMGGFQNVQEGPEKNFFENTDVLHLKMDNLSKLLNRRKIWFVYFFKSNNEGFQETKQKIVDIASQSYGIFNFGAVNCKDDEEICEDYSVYSTPKILYFPDSGKDEEEYKGPIEFQSFFKYGAKLMQNFVRSINKDNFNDFMSTHSERYHVLLFTSKKTTPPLFKALSKDYLNHLSFGEIRQTETELIKSFNINKFPTLLIITEPESNEVDIFKDELKYDTIKKFLNKYAYKKMQENKNIKVRELNSNTYESLGMCSSNDGKNICLIFFVNKDKLDNNEYKTLENIWNKFIDDHVKVFYLNISKYKEIFSSFKDDTINFENTSAVIVKGKRKKYIAISKENYSNIKDFYNIMDNVLSGGGSFKPLKNGLILSENNDNKSDL